MARALLLLAGGVVLSLLFVVVIAPTGPLVAAREWLLVTLTILVGTAVMAVVVRRARLRERAEELDAQHRAAGSHLPRGRSVDAEWDER